MTTINQLQTRRKEIVEVAGAVKLLIRPKQLSVAPIANVAHVLLCDLCKMMDAHLSDEHKSLFPELLINEDHSIQNVAWGLINNDRQLKPEYEAFKKRWLKSCEYQFTEEFIADTHNILEAIQKRMNLEKNTVIPRLETGHALSSI